MINTKITDDLVRNWALSHAYADGNQVEIAINPIPAFMFPRITAAYFNSDTAPIAQAVKKLGLCDYCFTGTIENSQYRYGIVRNGVGIGDIYFAINTGIQWCLENEYDLDRLAIFLHPSMCRMFRDFVAVVDGKEYGLNLIAIPQVEDGLSIRYFDAWFATLADYLIFDCTVENFATRTHKDIRYLGNHRQRGMMAHSGSWYAECARVAGVTHDPQYLLRPKKGIYDPSFAGEFGGKVIWHLRGSHVSKWYPHMRDVERELAQHGIEVAYIAAPNEQAACTSILGDGAKVIAHANIAAIASQIQRSNPLCFIGQETGLSAIVSLMPVRQLVLLSHTDSTRFADWKNCTAMNAEKPPSCWPCYLSHADFTRCHQDSATGAALCQVAIKPKQIVDWVLSCRT